MRAVAGLVALLVAAAGAIGAGFVWRRRRRLTVVERRLLRIERSLGSRAGGRLRPETTARLSTLIEAWRREIGAR